MTAATRKIIFIIFSVLSVLSIFFLFHLKFSFDFEQFFPDGDEDLEFFKDFIDNFESDDNFMLIAVRNKNGVFEQDFLERFHDFTLKCRALPHVEESTSLTKISYPLKTPFAITTIPAIHIKDPSKYERDKKRILNDNRFVYNLISADATAMAVTIKVINSIQLPQAQEFMVELNKLIANYNFEKHHYLGRPYFMDELVAMQKREIIVSAVVSSILVTLIMFLIFRRFIGISIALVSIGVGMLLFMGLLGAWGRELDAMSALYPVLMIIVGTSDVIHIMSKYIDELKKGFSQQEAIRTTIKEIGLATLLTSTTTAIGFATLVSSKIIPIRNFGINAALGVMIAYLTVVIFTTALLSMLRADQIMKVGRGDSFWDKYMNWFYVFTKEKPKKVAIGTIIVFALTMIGISQITTNYNIINNLPRGEKITEDFKYFEKKFTGFRPMEFAVFAKNGYKADDFEVIKEIDKVEKHLDNYSSIRATTSITALYKSINQMQNNNRQEAYKLPETKAKFVKYKKLASKLPQQGFNVLLSKDREKARISSRMLDMGADTVQYIGNRIDQWIAINTDSNIVEFKRTGTGLIIDKNAEYVRRDLLVGLGMAVVLVSLLMAFLFRNINMLIISLVPNIFPLLLAGALLGYLGIDLEAGISIVFAVVFGIAVDDTIHFLSKFKLARNKGMSIDDAIHVTFLETGKAICLTSVILFFGFLVMLFSIHPPSVTIGLLISLTLFSALFSDLFIIPVMIRWLIKE